MVQFENLPALSVVLQDESLLDLGTVKNAVLFFFPKARTPGCQKHAHDFNNRFEEFISRGFNVYGVSRDSCKILATWKDKEDFQFPFISDKNSVLATEFGFFKNNYLTRSHIVVMDGHIVDIVSPVKPGESVDIALSVINDDEADDDRIPDVQAISQVKSTETQLKEHLNIKVQPSEAKSTETDLKEHLNITEKSEVSTSTTFKAADSHKSAGKIQKEQIDVKPVEVLLNPDSQIILNAIQSLSAQFDAKLNMVINMMLKNDNKSVGPGSRVKFPPKVSADGTLKYFNDVESMPFDKFVQMKKEYDTLNDFIAFYGLPTEQARNKKVESIEKFLNLSYNERATNPPAPTYRHRYY